jgi:hypothetical protein
MVCNSSLTPPASRRASVTTKRRSMASSSPRQVREEGRPNDVRHRACGQQPGGARRLQEEPRPVLQHQHRHRSGQAQRAVGRHGRFKAPSEAQSLNTRKFFSSLSNLPDLSKAYASIKNSRPAKGAMASFKAPPLSQANNLVKFAQAIEKAAPAFRSLKPHQRRLRRRQRTGLDLDRHAGLKVPNAGEINRIGQFGSPSSTSAASAPVRPGRCCTRSPASATSKRRPPRTSATSSPSPNALHKIKPIPNAAADRRADELIASAATRASVTLGGFRGNLGGVQPGLRSIQRRHALGEGRDDGPPERVLHHLPSRLRPPLAARIADRGRAWPRVLPSHADCQPVPRRHAGPRRVADDERRGVGAVRADANHFGADLNNMAENFSKFSLAAHENGVSSKSPSKSSKASRPS